MKKLLGCAGFAITLFLAPLGAQTSPAPAKATGKEFEVASIKEAPPLNPAAIAAGKVHIGMKIDGAHVDIGSWPLMQLISKAYDVKTYQVQGPDWIKGLAAKRFDIVANMPPGATKDDVPQMLQALLRDRFKLELHEETKDRNVYALVVGKDGPKMKESTPAEAPKTEGPGVSGSNQMSFSASKGGGTVNDGEHTQRMTMSPDGKTMQMQITNADMALLAEGLTPMVDRPIVDMTGLKGKYDVTIDLSMADLIAVARAAGANIPNESAGGTSNNPAAAASDPASGSLFKAVEAMGLKLEPRKAPLKYLIIDKVEKTPTDN